MRCTLVIPFILLTHVLFAQKELTIKECEALFQKNNLSLLAGQFNIDAAKANIIQARIWQQPVLSAEFNAINPENKTFFDVGKSGQKALAIQQLLYLGGKKKNEVELARRNAAIATLQFEDILRKLQLEIRSNFYSIYFNQVKIESIRKQIDNLDTLLNEYTIQANKGNVALKEVVRLQYLSLSFKSELVNIQKTILDNQENLKLLIAENSNIIAKAGEEEIKNKLNHQVLYSESQLTAIAMQKNPAFKIAERREEYYEFNVKFQKSLAVPDLIAGASYDQRGGAFRNQVNMTVGIPLPLWNINKGNIRNATSQAAIAGVEKDQSILSLTASISNTLQSFNFQQKEYNQTLYNFQNFENVYTGILQNFQKRNISLIEFADFMESYNQSILFLNETKKQIIITGENLNYLTNEQVF
jgi:cobalt-zinc-cadmium efflux system outer membrane protein